jgi:threonine aldolase
MKHLDIIDLRSDTVTQPTAQMRAVMAEATCGDDVYGEDPTVNELEQTVAKLLGKEAALFVPSGTMGNQIALNVHCRPGDSIIAEQESHCFYYEAGASAALSGVQFDFVPYSSKWNMNDVRMLLRDQSIHSATTSLVVLENTHNRGGGRVLDVAKVAEISSWAKEQGLSVHCDGARLWNAASALGVQEKELVSSLDSVSVCFSKGLGAPVGSALVGDASFIARARKVRKRWGGGMRQAGMLAAGVLYALDQHRRRLSDDHRHASEIFAILNELAQFEVRYPEIGTNIVYFRHRELSGDELAKYFKDRQVLMHHLGDGWLRAVTHLQIVERHIEQFREIAKSGR